MRARLALLVSEQRCEWREVVLKDKPAALLAASPKGTVPVLVEPDGRVIDQSLDIMFWALSHHDPERWLAPEQDGPEAMMQLVAQCDGTFKTHLDRYKYPNRYLSEHSSGSVLGHAAAASQTELADASVVFSLAHRALGASFLQTLNQRLLGTPWLFGSRLCLADMAIAPFVRQFAQHDEAWFLAQDWPALQDWLHRFTNSPPFLAIMQKVPAWQPGMPTRVFPGE